MEQVKEKGFPRIMIAIFTTVAVWCVHIYFREGLDLPPGDPVRLTATGVLVIAFAWVIWENIRLSRKMDEFQRQIQYLALAIAYPLSLITTFALGFFRAEGIFAGADPRDLASLLLVSGAIGYVIAWKRYS